MFFDNEGGTITVIGQDGKPSQIPASSLNMAASPNMPFETFTSNIGATGNKFKNRAWEISTKHKYCPSFGENKAS